MRKNPFDPNPITFPVSPLLFFPVMYLFCAVIAQNLDPRRWTIFDHWYGWLYIVMWVGGTIGASIEHYRKDL
jgi:hypothetical protein